MDKTGRLWSEFFQTGSYRPEAVCVVLVMFLQNYISLCKYVYYHQYSVGVKKNDSVVLAINYHKLDDSMVIVFTSSIWKCMDVCTGNIQ